MASLGAQVVQTRAVEFAGKYKVPVRVLSTFKEGSGTLITFEEESMEQAPICGIAFAKDEAKLTIAGIPYALQSMGEILGTLQEANIEIDMVVQTRGEKGDTDISFTVHRRDYERAMTILQEAKVRLNARNVLGDKQVVKVSLVGMRMRSRVGVVSTIFKVLGAHGINIQLISTSEIKVSVVVDEKYLGASVKSLHEAFGLHEEPYEEEYERRRA
jgi:aspartate kinase